MFSPVIYFRHDISNGAFLALFIAMHEFVERVRRQARSLVDICEMMGSSMHTISTGGEFEILN